MCIESNKFKQEAWLKSYIDINMLRKNAKKKKKKKKDFEKAFFKFMNNAVFRKAIGNVRNYRNINLVTTQARRKYLVSELNYHTTKNFSDNLLAIEMKRTYIIMNKPVHLGL